MSNRPIEMLEEEHRVIQKMVKILEKMTRDLEKGLDSGVESIPDVVDFMRTFTDRLHHRKEEAILFPLLAGRGVPTQGCPLGVLGNEHVMGRALVGKLAREAEEYKGHNGNTRDELLTTLRELISLYPNHIWKEDYLLFPMTQKVLNEADYEHLQTKFEEADEIIGKAT